MSDIFQEIDEELRRDNALQLWKDYGNYVIAVAVAIVLITAAVAGWRDYQLKQHEAEGVRYLAALELDQQGKTAEAADALAAVARDSGISVATLARLEEAALRAKSGDTAAAAALFDKVAADAAVPQTYRDLAVLLSARQSLETGDPKAVRARLAPLTDPNCPWRSTALELTALAELKAGDRDASRTQFQRLADDLTAPGSLRARATEMAAALAQ